MKHWETAFAAPGFYSVARGSNNSVRQFAVPMSRAAMRVARESDPQAEMYPDAGSGDLTPLPVVVIDDVSELDELAKRAEELYECLEDPDTALECELVLV